MFPDYHIMRHGQTLSGALAHVLRSKERVKDLVTDGYGDARTSIGKANLDRAIREDLPTCLAHEARGTVESFRTADHRRITVVTNWVDVVAEIHDETRDG